MVEIHLLSPLQLVGATEPSDVAYSGNPPSGGELGQGWKENQFSLRVVIWCTMNNPHIRHKVRGLSKNKCNKRQRWSHDHLNNIIKQMGN